MKSMYILIYHDKKDSRHLAECFDTQDDITAAANTYQKEGMILVNAYKLYEWIKSEEAQNEGSN